MSAAMSDHNVFAILTAFDTSNMASSALRLGHNARWLCIADGGVAKEPNISSRETTPDPPTWDVNSPLAVDRLVITFDQLRDGLHDGIQLGSDPNVSHILLGYRGTPSISRKQCTIALDKNFRIMLYDRHSTYGNAVGQNKQHGDTIRTEASWILAFEPGKIEPFQFRLTTIRAGRLRLRIEFPNHRDGHRDYIKNLQIFYDRFQAAALARRNMQAIAELGTNSRPVTQEASGALTPVEQPICYRGKCLGSGSFGEVHLNVRASDGAIVATKTFKREPNKRKFGSESPEWSANIEREFGLMWDNSHVGRVPLQSPAPTSTNWYT
nr:hypothetical protein CFP56_01018 [Quercus suber]